jgi:hypothetical protein
VLMTDLRDPSFSIIVADLGRRAPRNGHFGCVQGIFKRRNGLTEAQAFARREPPPPIDGPSPYHLFYPCASQQKHDPCE